MALGYNQKKCSRLVLISITSAETFKDTLLQQMNTQMVGNIQRNYWLSTVDHPDKTLCGLYVAEC